MRMAESDYPLNFDLLLSEPLQRRRCQRLLSWLNTAVHIEVETVDDVVRQAYQAGFMKGAVRAKNGVDPRKVWLSFVAEQRGLDDSTPPLFGKVINSAPDSVPRVGNEKVKRGLRSIERESARVQDAEPPEAGAGTAL